MAHVNHFLAEIDQVERRQFKEAIIAVRVAGADEKGYTKYMNSLRQIERKVEQQTRPGRQHMTYEEQVKLEQQHHVKFNQLSQAEQDAITAERESLWSQIPPHIQAKSRKLAGR